MKILIAEGAPVTRDSVEACLEGEGFETVLASNEEIDVDVELEIGADDFIRKPFGKHELLARVRTALRRAEASPQSKPLQLIQAERTIHRLSRRTSGYSRRNQ